MTGRLDGQVAIITGASRGIGRAIAQAYAAEGAKVAVLGRTVDGLHETVRLCAGLSGTALAFACDVRQESDIAAAVASVVQTWGRIDILVNNAGIDDDTPFLEVDRARWRDIIDTNLTSVFIFSQEVARVMKEQGGGVILHTASIDGSGGDGPFAAYNSSSNILFITLSLLLSIDTLKTCVIVDTLTRSRQPPGAGQASSSRVRPPPLRQGCGGRSASATRCTVTGPPSALQAPG